MSKSKSNHKQKVAQWQLEKMRMIIADRWLETWEVVANREAEKMTAECGQRRLRRFTAEYR
ncbi:MAG: hypothetical protein QNJ55_11640 [Xenococcus sp. MO_188.B8]|nr:hypothetical protein [Xenococcus sp. MO_188.B8]